LVASGGKRVCLRRLGGDRAGEMRFTRWLRNTSVTLEEMSQTWFLRTQDVCLGRDILAVQDTTVTRSSGVGGDYLYATIAVDAQEGAVPGALDAGFPERTSGKKASRGTRDAQDKESHRWLAATERAGRLQGPRASRWWPIGRPMFST